MCVSEISKEYSQTVLKPARVSLTIIPHYPLNQYPSLLYNRRYWNQLVCHWPREAAWSRQLPSPEVCSGYSRGPISMSAHQFRKPEQNSIHLVCQIWEVHTSTMHFWI